jgi:uncharacterized RDD family membrane protein YckC
MRLFKAHGLLWMYEGMLMFGVVFIAGHLFGTLSQTRNALDNRYPLQAFVFVVVAVYFVWFWAKGRTLTMKTWHIRVVDINGRLPAARALSLLAQLDVVSAALAASWMLGCRQPRRLSTLAWVVLWAILARFHPQRRCSMMPGRAPG